MEKNSNNLFRNCIIRMIINNKLDDIELDEQTLIFLAAQKILKIFDSESELMQAIASNLIEVAFLDTFKVLNLKNRESNLNFEEMQIYNTICSIQSNEELENAVLTIDDFLTDMLNYTLKFNRLNILRKIKSIKSLSSAQYAFLNFNFNLFANDLDEYGDNAINVDTIVNYYKEEMQRYENTMYNNGAISANLNEEIIGFLKNLAGIDFDSFNELMENIIINDYKWGKYLIDHKLSIDSIDIEDFKEKSEMYEMNSIDSLILEEVLCDDYYLNSLVDGLILTKADNLYVDPEIINEDIVNEYYVKMLKHKK